MEQADLLIFLLDIHNLGDSPKSKLEICMALNRSRGGKNYRKIDELTTMGLLVQVNSNPPRFVPDRKKIWKFWKETPLGKKAIDFIAEHYTIITV